MRGVSSRGCPRSRWSRGQASRGIRPSRYAGRIGSRWWHRRPGGTRTYAVPLGGTPGGSPSATPMTTSTSPRCWCARTPAGVLPELGLRAAARDRAPDRARARADRHRRVRRTVAPPTGRAEREKATRQGREPARAELARTVRAAAVTAGGVDEFVARLRAAGVLVELRVAPSGDVIGYKVAVTGDVDADGRPVFFSGSKLAPDLSLPRLQAAWNNTGPGAGANPVDAARRRVDRARAYVTAARRGATGEDPDDIGHAAAAVLTAIRGWSPELHAAAEAFDRASRPPRRTAVVPGRTAAAPRGVARHLIRARRAARPGDDPAGGAVALAVALAALMQEIAAWQHERHRPHQAAAAAAAAGDVRRWVTSVRSAPPPSQGTSADRAARAPIRHAVGTARSQSERGGDPGAVRGLRDSLHSCRIGARAPSPGRFSALTYNGHRIHVDRSYATAVEG